MMIIYMIDNFPLNLNEIGTSLTVLKDYQGRIVSANGAKVLAKEIDEFGNIKLTVKNRQ